MNDKQPLRRKTLKEWQRETKAGSGRFDMKRWLDFKIAMMCLSDWWKDHAKNHP